MEQESVSRTYVDHHFTQFWPKLAHISILKKPAAHSLGNTGIGRLNSYHYMKFKSLPGALPFNPSCLTELASVIS